MKPSEILKKGLELLETKGWTQGTYARNAKGDTCYDPTEVACACGIGAIRLAAFGDTDYSSLRTNAKAYNTARLILNNITGNWIAWQDATGRAFAEVKAKFLEAINWAEAEEKIAA